MVASSKLGALQRKDTSEVGKNFRVAKERVTWLTNHERLQHLKPKRRDGISISVNVQLAVALRFVAEGSYIDIADIFGISEETPCLTVGSDLGIFVSQGLCTIGL